MQLVFVGLGFVPHSWTQWIPVFQYRQLIETCLFSFERWFPWLATRFLSSWTSCLLGRHSGTQQFRLFVGPTRDVRQNTEIIGIHGGRSPSPLAESAPKYIPNSWLTMPSRDSFAMGNAMVSRTYKSKPQGSRPRRSGCFTPSASG